MKFPTRKYLFYTGNRAASIFHSRLRLNFSALNHDLLKRNCSASSVCRLCGALVEDVKHYFFILPEYSSATLLFGDKWLYASDKKKIDFLLNRVPGFDFQFNVNLFSSVQSFISQSNRFS